MSDYIRKEEKDKAAIRGSLSSQSETALMELLNHAKMIIGEFHNTAMKESFDSVTVMETARSSRISANTMKNSLSMTSMNSSILEEGKKQADSYLGSMDSHSTIFDETRNYAANSVAQEEFRTEQETLDLTSRSNPYSPEGQKGTNLSDVFVGASTGDLIKSCIPCSIRPLGLEDIEITAPSIKSLWEDFSKKLEATLDGLNNLFLGNSFEEDLCDVLKLLDSQCLPDLFALLSLMGILFNKYQADLDLSFGGLLNALLAPLLTPLVSPFVVNINNYLNSIVNPITCILDSFEYQLGKIDIGNGINQFNAQKRTYNRKKIDFYNKKKQALERRKAAIEAELESNPGRFPRYTSSKMFDETSEIDNADTWLAKGAGSAMNYIGVERTTYGEEADKITKDINQIKKKIAILKEENENISDKESGTFDRTRTTLAEAKKATENAKNYLKSFLSQIINAGNRGVGIVRDTFEMYQLELERMLTGRVQTQQDQIEIARSLQKIQRYISIIKTIIDLKKSGAGSLLDRCSSSSSGATSSFVSAFKSQPQGENYNFYKGTDSDGNELMVITPGGTVVSTTGIEIDDLGEDELLGDVTLKDVQDTISYNNLNEVDEMNKKGVMLDLGNIGEKELAVSYTDASRKKTSLDLKAEQSYVIIKNDFCSKSPINVGSSESVRQWAELL